MNMLDSSVSLKRPTGANRLSFSASTVVVAVALICLAVLATLTPGFGSLPNLIALSGTISLIGCIAVGMTFVTLSGNIMSFSLGATCAATAMIVSHLSGLGLLMSIFAGIVFSMFVTGMQGWIIGYFRANPLIVSIAFLSLLLGIAQLVSNGQSIYVVGDSLDVFKQRVASVPVPAVVFVLVVVLGEAILRLTRFGQNVILVGSNQNAAIVAGIKVWRTVTGCYLIAGLFTGLSGVLVAARFGSGSMEFGVGYDYNAISAVLVGGTAIGGGSGSVLRTMIGVVVIAVLQSLLLLRGFDSQFQYLLIGLIVLAAIMLQAKRRAT